MHVFESQVCRTALGAHLLASALLFAAMPPHAGLVNAVVGVAFKNGAPISSLDVGSVSLGAGDSVSTQEGMVELLLDPGCILRIGHKTQLVITASRANGSGTDGFGAELKKGQAALQVLYVPSMPVAIEQSGRTVRVQTVGLYSFDEDRGTVSVYKGSADVIRAGSQDVLWAGEGAHLVSRFRKFPAAAPEPTSDLVTWNASRTEYLSLVSEDLAHVGNHPSVNSSRPDWYWDRFWNSYSLLPSTRSLIAPAYIPNTPIPWHGDPFLYGSPVLPPSNGALNGPPSPAQTPTVPLTGPGVPVFPNSRSGPRQRP